MTRHTGEIIRHDLKRRWTHNVALPADKVQGLMNSEVIFCAAGVLAASPLTYSLRRDEMGLGVAPALLALEECGAFAVAPAAGADGSALLAAKAKFSPGELLAGRDLRWPGGRRDRLPSSVLAVLASLAALSVRFHASTALCGSCFDTSL
jgi:hypothetical protein